MTYRIEFAPSAARAFKKLDGSIQKRLTPKIDALESSSRSLPLSFHLLYSLPTWIPASGSVIVLNCSFRRFLKVRSYQRKRQLGPRY